MDHIPYVIGSNLKALSDEDGISLGEESIVEQSVQTCLRMQTDPGKHEDEEQSKALQHRSVLFLAELEQDPESGLGMHKGDVCAMSAWTRLVVDKLDVPFFHRFEGSGEIIDAKGDMLDAFALLFDELGDGAILGSRRKELYAGISAREEGNLDLLTGDFLDRFQGQTELLVKGYTRVQILDCDTYMAYFLDHDFLIV